MKKKNKECFIFSYQYYLRRMFFPMIYPFSTENREGNCDTLFLVADFNFLIAIQYVIDFTPNSALCQSFHIL